MKQFVKFSSHQAIFYPHQVTMSLLGDYQLALYKERGLKDDTVWLYSNRIKKLFRYISDKGIDIIKDFDILPRPKLKDERLKRYYTFEDLLKRYIAMQRRWISFAYSNELQKHLRMFFRYLRAQGIKNVYSVTEATILKYRDLLWNEFKEGKDRAIVPESQVDRLRIVNKFFKFLYRERIIEQIPSFEIDWKSYFKKIREEGKNLSKPMRYKDWVPKEIKVLIKKFIDYETAKGKTSSTTKHYKQHLKVFFNFLDRKGITSIDQVTKRTLLDYYTYLVTYKGLLGRGIASSTRAHILFSVKVFFQFLTRFDFISKDPTENIEAMKEEKTLPKDYMNEKEMFRVLERPNLNNILGLRDRAIMEVLFSTGVRSNELRYLDLKDVDYHEGMLRINHPKGGPNYQRVIPVGDVALRYLRIYLEQARPKLENGHDTQAIFLTYTGKRIDRDTPLSIVKKYSYQVGIRKNITVHSFRVSCATLMLKNRAGIRHVQEQLGHRCITSTQIYTRLCPLDLKAEHKKYHPRENHAMQNVHHR